MCSVVPGRPPGLDCGVSPALVTAAEGESECAVRDVVVFNDMSRTLCATGAQPQVATPALVAPLSSQRPTDWLRLVERVIGGWAPTLRTALLLLILIIAAMLLLVGLKAAALTAALAGMVKAVNNRRVAKLARR
jgi:hypothetical protein